MNQRVPILVYHHVHPDGHPDLANAPSGKATGTVSRSEFRRQMTHIVEQGWEVVSTTQVVDWLEHNARLPARAMALHFDNGWLDTMTVAMPILRELGMAAMAYVITEGTTAATEGQGTTINTTTEGVIEKPFLTWEHVRELLDAGWEVGGHTATHARLGELCEREGDQAVVREIEASNEEFDRRLGQTPAHFAYPSGSRSRQTDVLLAEHYRSLRLWHYGYPPEWTFTDGDTSPLALECQNIDSMVSFEDFSRIFVEALQV